MKQWHITYSDLPELLRKLCEAGVSRTGGDRIVHATADFSTNVIRWMQYRKGYTFSRMGLSVQDVAFDTVAELLVDGTDGPCSRLRTFLKAASDLDQVSLLSKFKAIVIRTVQQNVVRMFADFDPTRARLLSNLRRHAHAAPHINVRDTCMGRLYAHADPKIARLHLRPAPEDRLAHVVGSASHDGSPIVSGLEACLSVLAKDPEVRCAVYEHDILRLVVDRLGRDLDTGTISLPDALREMQEQELRVIIEKALDESRAWIAYKYVRSGRLSEQEAVAIVCACRSALLDAAFSAQQDHFVYMKESMPDLTYEQYRSEYRNRTEYIYRRIFSSVGARLLNLEQEERRSAPTLLNVG